MYENYKNVYFPKLLDDPLISEEDKRKIKDLLKPKQCPNCDEPNTPETKFCIKCRYVLSYDAYNETIEEKEKAAKEAEESKKRLEELEAKQEILQANAASVLRALMAAEMGAKPPQVEIITWNSNKEGSEGLFKAAEIARAENQKREKEHQEKHHNPNNRRLVI